MSAKNEVTSIRVAALNPDAVPAPLPLSPK
jgi:hypothetical protein